MEQEQGALHFHSHLKLVEEEVREQEWEQALVQGLSRTRLQGEVVEEVRQLLEVEEVVEEEEQLEQRGCCKLETGGQVLVQRWAECRIQGCFA